MNGVRSLIAEYFTERFRQQESDGFSLLKQIPSVTIKRFIAAYNCLSGAEKEWIRGAIGSTAASRIMGDANDIEDSEERQFYRRFRDIMPYLSEFALLDGKKMKAVELRKMAKLMFSLRMGAEVYKDMEPGDWHYEGEIGGDSVDVLIRYSTRLGQVVYGVTGGPGEILKNLSYEKLMGISAGNWNLITDRNIDMSFALLWDMICQLLEDAKVVAKLLE